jgi:hypothetical protein
MPITKAMTLLLTLVSISLVFAVFAVPTVFAYEWLSPATFWQKFAFASSVFVVVLVPFKGIRKSGANQAKANPARYAAMRDEAIRYSVLPKSARQVVN